jgi:hypothetical protein
MVYIIFRVIDLSLTVDFVFGSGSPSSTRIRYARDVQQPRLASRFIVNYTKLGHHLNQHHNRKQTDDWLGWLR